MAEHTLATEGTAMVAGGCSRPSRISRRFAALVLACALTLVLPFRPVDAAAAEVVCDQKITASDGTLLSANVAIPDPGVRQPTILMLTPYNKDGVLFEEQEPCATNIGDLGDAGYATVVVDVRGTGRSLGTYDVYGPRDRQDAADVLEWIVDQPWSDGTVGVAGSSAMAILGLGAVTADQQRVGAGLRRIVQAAWVDCPFPDPYRDAFLDAGGMGAQSILLAASSLAGVGHATGYDPTVVPLDQTVHFHTQLYTSELFLGLREDFHSDGPLMYFGDFWAERDVSQVGGAIEVPVVMTVGLSDAINSQRGALYYFDQLQAAPQRVLLFSPGPHCAMSHFDELGYGSYEEMQVAFFDHWMRDADNGFDEFPSINFYPFNGTRWLQADAHPMPGTRWTRVHLDAGPSGTISSINDGSLSFAPGGEGQDLLPYVPAHVAMAPPCTGVAECGPAIPGHENALTYTSEPLDEDLTVAGLITAQLFAGFDRDEGTIALTLWDVAPDGTAGVLSQGRLRGSLRAIDPGLTTYGPNGQVIRPYHPMTRESQRPTGPGIEEYLVEFNPIAAVLPASHRLRLSVSITDGTLEQSAFLNSVTAGETMTLTRGGEEIASNILLPVLAAASADPADPGEEARDRGEEARDTGERPPPEARRSLPATGGGGALPAAVLLTVVLVLQRARLLGGGRP